MEPVSFVVVVTVMVTVRRAVNVGRAYCLQVQHNLPGALYPSPLLSGDQLSRPFSTARQTIQTTNLNRPYDAMLFDDFTHIEDILLQVVLGHSLPGSKSLLTFLSKDIIRNPLASAIEDEYWQRRSEQGLLTPKQMPLDRSRSTHISELIELHDQTLGRDLRMARPLPISRHVFRIQRSIWTCPASLEGDNSAHQPSASRSTRPRLAVCAGLFHGRSGDPSSPEH